MSANGDINDIGTIVTIGSEQFYTIGTEGDNVKLLAMYNLYVGGTNNNDTWTPYVGETTNMQDENMKGWNSAGQPYEGTTAFSSDTQKGTNYNDYNGSIVEIYVNNYKNILESEFGIEIQEARIIKYSELLDEKIGCTQYSCSDAPKFIYSTSYWVGEPSGTQYVWSVRTIGALLGSRTYYQEGEWGVRPVIIISKDYFN